ncbi:MAG: D-amino-acid transaminase [Alphaproteobacteria bacterium]
MPPGRIAYVDRRYAAHGEAGVHIEDRGLQFADSVYEICAVVHGRFLDEDKHLARLKRSLAEIGMELPMSLNALKIVMQETVRRNRVRDGTLYLQITRGACRRDHSIPERAQPTLIVACRPMELSASAGRRAEGVAVISLPDTRWARCDIKSTGLLPNVLAKSKARRKGAYEAWFVDREGFVTEGASTNAWIVTGARKVVTRQLGPAILPGVTRATAIHALAEAQLTVDERPFRLEEAYAASEAFITAATAGVLPVVRIDGRVIGDGKPGPVSARVYTLYRTAAEREAGL